MDGRGGPARQLHLFRGKRQRGTLPPGPKEFALHCAFADAVRLGIMPGWRWSHIPLGEYRDPATAGRLKRMGVNAGVPDFMFLGPERSLLFVELKREGGSLSEPQIEWAAHIMACGFGYLCTSDLEDAIGTLRDMGIVRARVSA